MHTIITMLIMVNWHKLRRMSVVMLVLGMPGPVTIVGVRELKLRRWGDLFLTLDVGTFVLWSRDTHLWVDGELTQYLIEGGLDRLIHVILVLHEFIQGPS